MSSMTAQAPGANPQGNLSLRKAAWGLALAGKHRGAMLKLRKALSNQPSDLVALRMMGNLHDLMGKFSSARLYYRRLLNVDPQNFTAKIDLADNYAYVGQRKRASGLYRKVISQLRRGQAIKRRKTLLREAYLSYIYLLRDSGQTAISRKVARQALNCFPKSAQFHEFAECSRRSRRLRDLQKRRQETIRLNIEKRSLQKGGEEP